MPRSTLATRVLGPADLPGLLDLVARDPWHHVFLEYRARVTRLDPRWLGGQVWGVTDGGRLVAACHSGANLVPAAGFPEALDAFADRALQDARHCSSIGGLAAEVAGLWRRLEPQWAPARDERWNQPHLAIDHEPRVTAEPRVRRTTPADFDVLYPACVAMFTEEVGVSPEDGGGRALYEARVRQLIEKGWSYALVEHGRVLFKAEVAAATPSTCQIQGVYVDPRRRGQGLATTGMAAVVRMARRDIAPAVTLYVNDHNLVARRVYEKVGFHQTGVFATVLF